MTARPITRREAIAIDWTCLAELDAARIDLARVLARTLDARRHARQRLKSRRGDRLAAQATEFACCFGFGAHNDLGSLRIPASMIGDEELVRLPLNLHAAQRQPEAIVCSGPARPLGRGEPH